MAHYADADIESVESIEDAMGALEVLDPHRFCPECKYRYPYPLRRALKPKVEGTTHDPVPVVFNLSEAPCMSESEFKWKKALLQKNMSLLKVNPNPNGPFPSLQYLAKVSLWETYRPYLDAKKKVRRLPIKKMSKKDFITLIDMEKPETDLEKNAEQLPITGLPKNDLISFMREARPYADFNKKVQYLSLREFFKNNLITLSDPEEPHLILTNHFQQLPISKFLKNHLIAFIDELEDSLRIHIRRKFYDLIFCADLSNVSN